MLKSEWNASQLWSNLSCFDGVYEDKLQPALNEADDLCATLNAQLQEEVAHLWSLGEIRKDAEHMNALVQSQVRVTISASACFISFILHLNVRQQVQGIHRLDVLAFSAHPNEIFTGQVKWCTEVTVAAMKELDSNLIEIDSKIECLLKNRASKIAVRERLRKRIQSLQAQGEAEANGFQNFISAYEKKGVELLDREGQAKIGLEAAVVLRQGLEELFEAMKEEMANLKIKAHELQLDVAADLAVACSLGHNVNFVLEYYEQEHKSALENLLREEKLNYKRALRQNLTDKAQKCAKEIITLKIKLEASDVKIACWAKKTELTVTCLAEVWPFLCANAVSVPTAPGAQWINIRTSAANRKAWDRLEGDRVLEQPDEWNEKMKFEADQVTAKLRLDNCSGVGGVGTGEDVRVADGGGRGAVVSGEGSQCIDHDTLGNIKLRKSLLVRMCGCGMQLVRHQNLKVSWVKRWGTRCHKHREDTARNP